ncbi:MAG: helix-turn-helix domain-containing protein [Acidithiobacillus ferriphilus]
MANHPNRGPLGTMGQSPSPAAILAERMRLGHTQSQAARSIWCTERAWQNWEQGERRMHAALWWLYTHGGIPTA